MADSSSANLMSASSFLRLLVAAVIAAETIRSRHRRWLLAPLRVFSAGILTDLVRCRAGARRESGFHHCVRWPDGRRRVLPDQAKYLRRVIQNYFASRPR